MSLNIPIYDICTISEDRNEDILISRLDAYSQNNQHLHAPHKHSFYHVLFFTKGNGSHIIDFEKFEVKQNQIYFMTPGQVHSWNFDSIPEGYIINFSPSFYQSFLLKPDYIDNFFFFNGIAEDAVINLTDETAKPVIDLFESIIMEANGIDFMEKDMIKTLLLQIFIKISRLKSNASNSVKNNYNYTIFNNFKKLIEQNYTRLRLPKDYAALLYITPNHLNALCNDFVNISAGDLIRNRIILEAKRLLINLDLSISEIAYRLNFSDNSNFTKFFKKYVGTTPEEFRRKN